MKAPIRSSRCKHCAKKIHLIPLKEENRCWIPGNTGYHPDGEWQTSYGRLRWSCKGAAYDGHEPMDQFIHAAQLALIEKETSP